ncbi:ABC transporter ATP-binding protein [Litorilituus lipolyticus]|uniref:ABC transporter ATP-binding protein n=1 Tax=Litorilituus lipolyticus TaxID=2491017 RepID=A0A502KQD1_9GAMM|nr:ABC transporter ATP-binding protein [Litorilituus lipolyticus]TPH12221.1 ABC transporter ATP-binding protein [Litorilituus lipolyticus]
MVNQDSQASQVQHKVIIKAEQLAFRYPSNDFPSIDNVTVTLKKGKCTGIIGPNGAGKSTLISLLCGLLTPEKGQLTYYVDDESSQAKSTLLTKATNSQAFIEQHIALIPQEYAFYPELTVKQNLQYFIAISERKRDKQASILAASLAQCQLTHVANKKAASLSGGYKRRLNIAIALSKSPDIIFLDEPTVGIDPVSRQEIIDLLKTLKAQGKSLVYTSHMLNEVEQLCDDIILLEQGKALAVSDLTSSNMMITVSFLAHPNTEMLRKQLQVLLPDIDTAQTQLNIKIADISQLNAIFTCLAQNMLVIKQLHFSQNSIDQLYFSVYHSKQATQDGAC